MVFFNLRGNIVSVISLLTRYNNLYVLIENYEKIKIEVTGISKYVRLQCSLSAAS